MGPLHCFTLTTLCVLFAAGLARGQDAPRPTLGAPEARDESIPLVPDVAFPPTTSIELHNHVPPAIQQVDFLAPVSPQKKLPDLAPPVPVVPSPPPPTVVEVYVPRVLPRLTVRQDSGDGVGYTRGFVYAEGFLPIAQAPGNAVLFLDGRAVNFLAGNRWEWNAGVGARWRPSGCDWVFGINSFLDWRDTGRASFRQIGVGFEALGPIVELRGNIYSPFGTTRRFVQDGGFSNPQFSGFNILLDHARVYQNAMRGFDLEVGAPVPYLERWGVRAFAGYYHYEAGGVPTIDGARARLEAQVNDHVSLHLQLQNDHVFDTTIQGGIALHFGPERPSAPIRSPVDRLGQRVVRDPNIVVATTTDVTKEVALDPLTGLPIIVRHVNNSAHANGNGTFERPYQTLEQLEKNSQPGDILFAHVNSVFTDQYIVLRDRQRFLGEGILHQFTALQGTFYLPNRPGNAPLIYQTCGCSASIELANSNEVSGFTIDQPDSLAIYGDRITNFNINRNTLTNAGDVAILLQETGGVGIIANNTIGQTLSNKNTYGFVVADSTGTLRLLIANNTTFGHDGGAGVIDLNSSTNILALLQNNRFLDTSTGITAVGSNGTLGLHFLGNASTSGYDLTESGGTFLLANTQNTNTGIFTLNNNVQVVPVNVLYASFP